MSKIFIGRNASKEKKRGSKRWRELIGSDAGLTSVKETGGDRRTVYEESRTSYRVLRILRKFSQASGESLSQSPQLGVPGWARMGLIGTPAVLLHWLEMAFEKHGFGQIQWWSQRTAAGSISQLSPGKQISGSFGLPVSPSKVPQAC